jgi:hypothetical protein
MITLVLVAYSSDRHLIPRSVGETAGISRVVGAQSEGFMSTMTLEQIERLIDEGAHVVAVEPLIDSLAIEPDEKSALWLRAWCQHERHHKPQPLAGAYHSDPRSVQAGTWVHAGKERPADLGHLLFLSC